MRIRIDVPLTTYIDKSKLQETFEILTAIKKLSDDKDPESMLNKYLTAVTEKLDYLKYRQVEIEDQVRQGEEAKEIRENERKRQEGSSSST